MYAQESTKSNTRIETQRLSLQHIPSTISFSNLQTGTPIIRLTVCGAQSKKTVAELECCCSINKANELFCSKRCTAGYLTLCQVISAGCDRACEASGIQISPSCRAIPKGRCTKSVFVSCTIRTCRITYHFLAGSETVPASVGDF